MKDINGIAPIPLSEQLSIKKWYKATQYALLLLVACMLVVHMIQLYTWIRCTRCLCMPLCSQTEQAWNAQNVQSTTDLSKIKKQVRRRTRCTQQSLDWSIKLQQILDMGIPIQSFDMTKKTMQCVVQCADMAECTRCMENLRAHKEVQSISLVSIHADARQKSLCAIACQYK
jgi:hypothetical protein